MDTFDGTDCIKKYPNGNIYHGAIKNLKAEGDGRLKYQSGNQYDGQFYKDGICRGTEGIISGKFAVKLQGRNLIVPEIQ